MKKSKSVLLIEDDKDDQEFFIEVLSENKTATLYDVANNGREALDRLQNTDILPDLIFMDIHMPVMNGIECLSEIVKSSQINNIPVVILSTDTWYIEVVRELGAKAFLKKTSDGKILRKQLDQMINLDFILDSQVANQTFQAYC